MSAHKPSFLGNRFAVCGANKRVKAGRRRLPIRKLLPGIITTDMEHPHAHEIASLVKQDCGIGPDLLLIIGTTLAFDGPRSVARQFSRQVRARQGVVIYISRSKPASGWSRLVDYWVECDCDDWVSALLDREATTSSSEAAAMAARRAVVVEVLNICTPVLDYIVSELQIIPLTQNGHDCVLGSPLGGEIWFR